MKQGNTYAFCLKLEYIIFINRQSLGEDVYYCLTLNGENGEKINGECLMLLHPFNYMDRRDIKIKRTLLQDMYPVHVPLFHFSVMFSHRLQTSIREGINTKTFECK